MTRSITTAILLASLGLSLAACGHQPGERAVSGGMIGAGVGTVAAAVVGAPLLGGALIGGAVGAVGGAATSPHDVNMGTPIWKQ